MGRLDKVPRVRRRRVQAHLIQNFSGSPVFHYHIHIFHLLFNKFWKPFEGSDDCFFELFPGQFHKKKEGLEPSSDFVEF